MTDELARRVLEAGAFSTQAGAIGGGPYRALATASGGQPPVGPSDLMMGDLIDRGVARPVIDDRRHGVVERFVVARRQRLPRIAHTPVPGRLFSFLVDDCYFDGVAAAETNGFLDERDLPPWETWIAYWRGRRALISWVPESECRAVDAAVRAHVVDAYAWLNGPETEELRGVLGA